MVDACAAKFGVDAVDLGVNIECRSDVLPRIDNVCRFTGSAEERRVGVE